LEPLPFLLFWSLFLYSQKKTKNYPSQLAAAFDLWPQPFPLGLTQPLPVGFFYSQNKQNQSTGYIEEKRIKI